MTYKDYPKRYIGSSDIASLIVRTPEQLKELHFGGDNEYYAYVCDGDAEIGGHYALVAEGHHWIRIYDDEELTFAAEAETIKVYRAGDWGCVIVLEGSPRVAELD